jgi:hypothetical protein
VYALGLSTQLAYAGYTQALRVGAPLRRSALTPTETRNAESLIIKSCYESAWVNEQKRKVL